MNHAALSGHLDSVQHLDPADYEAGFAISVQGNCDAFPLRNMIVAARDKHVRNINPTARSITSLVKSPFAVLPSLQ